jgi:hypothetical protein
MTSILLEIKIGLDPTIVSIAGLDITWHGLLQLRPSSRAA